MKQLASALDYAHAHGCVHCDVKPANILLDAEGRAVLSDFGIARLMSEDQAAGGLAARTPDALMGTPDYISPEQALGRMLDGRSDVYSLGITLFYMLTKRLPFKADTTIALVLLQVHEPPPSLALIRADISPLLDHVVRKALAKEPKDRFQTAGMVCAAFAQAVEASDTRPLLAVSAKRARLRRGAFAASQPFLLAGKPIVRLTPLPRRQWVARSVGNVAIVLIAISIVLGCVSYVATTRSSYGSAPVRNSVALDIHNAAGDRLLDHEKWPLSSTFFYDQSQGEYHIVNTSLQNVALALYEGQQFRDFRLHVTTTEIRSPADGINFYGVVFRGTADQSRYYLFEIAKTGGGQYTFWRYSGQWEALASGSLLSLQRQPGMSNVVEVEARGNTFTFSVNDRPVGPPVTDTSKEALVTGQVGLYVEYQGAEVAFSHLLIESIK